MADLCSSLDREVAAMEGAHAGLQSRGAALVGRAAQIRGRIAECAARVLDQVIIPRPLECPPPTPPRTSNPAPRTSNPNPGTPSRAIYRCIA